MYRSKIILPIAVDPVNSKMLFFFSKEYQLRIVQDNIVNACIKCIFKIQYTVSYNQYHLLSLKVYKCCTIETIILLHI